MNNQINQGILTIDGIMSETICNAAVKEGLGFVKNVLSNLTGTNIATNLLNSVEEIHKLEISLLKTNQSLSELQTAKDNIKDVFMMQVISQVDDKGKAVYSNDTARRIETDARLSINEKAIDLSERIQNLKKVISEDTITLHRQSNLMSAYKAILYGNKEV